MPPIFKPSCLFRYVAFYLLALRCQAFLWLRKVFQVASNAVKKEGHISFSTARKGVPVLVIKKPMETYQRLHWGPHSRIEDFFWLINAEWYLFWQVTFQHQEKRGDCNLPLSVRNILFKLPISRDARLPFSKQYCRLAPLPFHNAIRK